MEWEIILNEMAYKNVMQEEYPEHIQNISEQVLAKQNEIQDYISGKITRPQPKSVYLKLLDDLEKELNALETENKKISETNNANRKVVDEKYLSDIEAYKSDINNVWNAVREIRDDKLLKCDWTQIPDSPKANQQVWLDYRQALRDITLQEDPYNLVWPIMPSED